MSRLRWFIHEAWRGLLRHRSMTLTALASLTGALLITALFLLFTANTRVALSTLGDRREVIAYLKDSAPRAEVDSLLARVAAEYGRATYVSREQAWDEFSKELGGTELLEAVGQNPLPASIRLRLKPELRNYASMERVANSLAAEDVVEEVRFGGEWVRRLDRFVANLTFINWVVGGAMALAVLFVVMNTIRLIVVARRELLRILSLIGAGSGFTFSPLLIEGVLLAGSAAVLALGLLAGVWAWLDGRPVALVFLPWQWSLAFVAGGGLLGLIGSALALTVVTRKH